MIALESTLQLGRGDEGNRQAKTVNLKICRDSTQELFSLPKLHLEQYACTYKRQFQVNALLPSRNQQTQGFLDCILWVVFIGAGSRVVAFTVAPRISLRRWIFFCSAILPAYFPYL
jgi:hypothetical protein